MGKSCKQSSKEIFFKKNNPNKVFLLSSFYLHFLCASDIAKAEAFRATSDCALSSSPLHGGSEGSSLLNCGGEQEGEEERRAETTSDRTQEDSAEGSSPWQF